MVLDATRKPANAAGHARRIGLAALLAFVPAAVASFVWGGLLVANVRTPATPWSIPVMAVVLVAYWLYLAAAAGRAACSPPERRCSVLAAFPLTSSAVRSWRAALR